MSDITSLVENVVKSLVSASADGKLDVSEVIKIGTELSKTLKLTPHEKKAVVSLALKKGLDEVKASSELKKAVDTVVDAVSVSTTLLSSLKHSLLKCLPVCSRGVEVLALIDPKDAELVAKALKEFQEVEKKLESTLESLVVTVSEKKEDPVDLVSVPAAAEVVPANIPEKNKSEKEPNPEASPQESPSLTLRENPE